MSSPHGVVPDAAVRGLRGGLVPIARGLAGFGISANAVTVAGSLLTLVGATLLVASGPAIALAPLALGALADSLDGAVARVSRTASVFGSFLDSTLDRISDAATLAAAAVIAARETAPLEASLALVALVASSLVPYTRAKAEALGLSATVGVAPREARVVLLLLGVALWAVSGQRAVFTLVIAVTAILATVTVVQRVAHVARQRPRNQ